MSSSEFDCAIASSAVQFTEQKEELRQQIDRLVFRNEIHRKLQHQQQMQDTLRPIIMVLKNDSC